MSDIQGKMKIMSGYIYNRSPEKGAKANNCIIYGFAGIIHPNCRLFICTLYSISCMPLGKQKKKISGLFNMQI